MEGLDFDFSNLQYNPLELEENQYIWDKYPKLRRRVLFCSVPTKPERFHDFGKGDLNKLVCFVILFVDPLSPFFDEKDFDYRAQLVLEALGFSRADRFFKEVEDYTDYYNDILFEYFRMVSAIEYETWFSLKENLHRINKQIRGNTIKDSDRRHLMGVIQTGLDDIMSIEHRLFPDERTANYIRQKASETSYSGYPEQYALNLPTYEESDSYAFGLDDADHPDGTIG